MELLGNDVTAARRTWQQGTEVTPGHDPFPIVSRPLSGLASLGGQDMV